MQSPAQLVCAALCAAAIAMQASPVAAQPDGEAPWTLDIPLDAMAQAEDCPFMPDRADTDREAVYEYMTRGPASAVACVELLDRLDPQWHRDAGADRLVGPFVDYLLGDGTSRGMQRHAIFIDLLGHLEKIAPDWRWRPETREKIREIILASVVEDPFVADVWARTLPEMDEDWRDTDTAQSLVPDLYQLALEQAERPPGPRNERPAMLLRELSLWNYVKLLLATRVFDSPAKVALWLTLLLGAIYLVIRRRSRARKTGT